MKQKIRMPLVILFYVLSFYILIYCMKVRLTPRVYLNTDLRLILLFMVCILIYINGYILIKKMNYNKKILKINLITFCLIYTALIFTLTLFDEIYGRRGFTIVRWNRKLLDYYFGHSFNIIPFKTIKLFVNGYFSGIVSFRGFIMNILGNLCAFMPYAIFLPLMLKSMKKYSNFLIVMVLMVLIIEAFQFVTLSGSCDIDDLILNVLGASLVYFVVKIRCINKFICKIFLYE